MNRSAVTIKFYRNANKLSTSKKKRTRGKEMRIENDVPVPSMMEGLTGPLAHPMLACFIKSHSLLARK